MRSFFLLLCLCLSATAAELTLQVGQKEPKKLTLKDLENFPREEHKVVDQDGVEATWKGIPLYQVLLESGVSFGKMLRGPALSQYLLVTASDGYQVVLALPELDPTITQDPIILAIEKNGQPLSADEGPLRLILPNEKRPFRWVRQVVKIEVLKAGTPAE